MSFVYTTHPSITSSATISVSGIQPTSSITTTSSALNNSYITISGSNGMSYDDFKPNTLHVRGKSEFEDDANFSGNVTIDGVNLAQSIKNIEARLNILRPNHNLESEWDELRELGERYRQLERDMLEKLALVDTLKKKY
jgi:phospholipase/lecithinase/hemolysin